MLRDTPREVLNVEQAAEVLGLSPFTVREKARLGELRGRKMGRQWRFLRTAVLEFCSATKREENVVSESANQRHTLRHSALATAVRVLIQLEARRACGIVEDDYVIQRQRMQLEIAKWDGTDDIYALGIMAPVYALS